MRRKDRQVSDYNGIIDILGRCDVIRIGLCDGGMPYIVPMNFAFETDENGLTIYLHSAASGRKMDIIAQNDIACFEADCSYELIKSDTPARWSAKYESVMGEGKISVISDIQEKKHALDELMKRYGYNGKPFYSPEALSMVAALKIVVSKITGKRNM